MRIERGFAIVLAVAAMLAAAMPAAAHHDRDVRKIEVRGIIVAMDARTQAFLLREDRPRGTDHLWVVQMQSDTRLKIEGRDKDDDDNDLGGRNFVPRVLPRLEVGQFVEVEGRVIADGRILAREIKLLGHTRAVPPQVIVVPPPVLPPFPQPPFFGFPQQPQIFFPQNGAVINTAEFTVIGRTFPFAQVHIDVMTVWAFFQFGAASADVTADGNGFFATTVRPSIRLPGATYRITVTSRVSGVALPPTTINVSQQ